MKEILVLVSLFLSLGLIATVAIIVAHVAFEYSDKKNGR